MTSGKTDEIKGRIKEVAGTVTGDEQLKKEGQAEQVVAKVKQTVESVVEKVKDTFS